MYTLIWTGVADTTFMKSYIDVLNFLSGTNVYDWPDYIVGIPGEDFLPEKPMVGKPQYNGIITIEWV